MNFPAPVTARARLRSCRFGGKRPVVSTSWPGRDLIRRADGGQAFALTTPPDHGTASGQKNEASRPGNNAPLARREPHPRRTSTTSTGATPRTLTSARYMRMFHVSWDSTRSPSFEAPQRPPRLNGRQGTSWALEGHAHHAMVTWRRAKPRRPRAPRFRWRGVMTEGPRGPAAGRRRARAVRSGGAGRAGSTSRNAAKTPASGGWLAARRPGPQSTDRLVELTELPALLSVGKTQSPPVRAELAARARPAWTAPS